MPTCCGMKQRTCNLCCGTTSLVLGLILLIVGGVLPRRIGQIFAEGVKETILIKGDRLDVSPIRGTSYGGTEDDAEDNGALQDYYFVDITNIAAVLQNGSQPLVREVGPFAYRKYITTDTTCPNSNDACGVSATDGIETWYERPSRLYDGARSAAAFSSGAPGGPLDATYVTVPNIGYRALEAQFVAMSGGLVSNFDSIAMPLFGVSGLKSLLNPKALELGLRNILLPLSITRIYTVATNTLMTATSSTQTQAQQAIITAFIANTPSSAPLILGQDLSSGANQMLFPVASMIFDNTNTAMSPMNPQAWALASAALMECSASGGATTGPAMTAYATAFVTATAAADPTYLNGAAPSTKALSHIGLLLAWYGSLLSTATTSIPVAATAAKTAAATVLHTAGVLSANTWNDVLMAQLGSNSILGVLETLGGNSANPTTRAGTGVDNACPVLSSHMGASFADIGPIAQGIPGQQIPEFSCWNSRLNTATSFGTRLSSSEMSTFIATVTSGPSMIPAVSNSSALTGTGVMATFLGGAKALAAAVAANNPVALQHVGGVALVYAQYKAGAATAAQYATTLSTLGNCPAALNPVNLPLPCATILDLAGWVNHIAHNIVWQPSFVQRGVTVFDPSTQSFGPHPDPYFAALASEANPMRAGPFIRCTVREMLEIGCHDNFLDYVNQLLSNKVGGAPNSRIVPFGPTDYTGTATDTAWTAYKAATRPDSRNTGITSVEKIDQITKYQAQSEITVWGGPASTNDPTNPVVGGYSGLQFPPTLDLNVDYEKEAWKSLTVWVYQGLRSVKLSFTKTVNAPSTDKVKLWRYELAPSQTDAEWLDSIPQMDSDVLAHGPVCAANVAAVANGAPLYVAKPYFVGCSSSAWNGNAIPGYAYSDSIARDDTNYATYLDVEPITGLTMNAHKRLGAHLYWKSSPWYPALVETFGLVYWADYHGEAPAKRTEDFGMLVGRLRTGGTQILPGVLCGLGALIFLGGLYCVIKGWRTPKSPFVSDVSAIPGGKDNQGTTEVIVVSAGGSQQQQQQAYIINPTTTRNGGHNSVV